jgi:hypothetical protein
MRYVVLAGLAALAAPPVAAQTAIGDLGARPMVEIEGSVTEVFGNKFVLRDATGSVLVTNGPSWHHQLDVAPGETLRVAGELDEDEFDAFRIYRSDGEVIEIRPVDGPPPWAGGPNRGRD